MELEKRPLFSVIVPVYKVEKYLNQCVDSILAQTFSDFELILVDDGSPDCCGAICDAYARKDPRVKVIHKENGGLVSARRAGYGICTGQYIFNMDSDDYIVPNVLEMAAEKIQAHGVDVVLFGYVHFSESTATEYVPRVSPGLYAGKKMDVIRRNLILGEDSGAGVSYSIWSKIMRRECIDPYFTSFPTTVCRGEDLIVTAPVLAACSSVYVFEECLYYYRITPGSIVNSHRGNELEQALMLAEYLAERMGAEYRQKLDSYILLECFDHLSHYRENWQKFRQEVLRIRNDRLVKHLKGAKCGPQTSLPNRAAFFLLRHQMFGVLWLIWKIKG